jgi:hypothetical protein
MVWWNDALYVGTAREYLCVSLFAIWDFVAGTPSLGGLDFANTYLTYPPTDPDMSCAPDGSDLSIQAEIWRWTAAGNGTWQRVFQSPLALNNPGPGGTGGAPTVHWQGKKLPYEYSFRGLAPFTEPDGTEALYAFGTNTDIMWDGTKLPLPRILRSTDGLTFTPIPQTPGTFLGDLPFTSDHSSYRSPVSFANKLFVLSGTVMGNGNLIASADPAKGDNAWFLASPPGMQFYALAVFNGWLYLGGFDLCKGINPLVTAATPCYTVLKTQAQGTPPYQLVTVVPKGAYLTNMPSDAIVSMHEYFGRLYVGTDNFAEVIRINPDDTWDLVVGAPRAVPLPNGGSEVKYPVSGLDAGFGNTLNVHAWQADDPFGYLYIGTYNASTAFRCRVPNDNNYCANPNGSVLVPSQMGAQLYRTHDGWYYSAITTNGFADPSDPHGGKFDYGIRNMASTPHGFFAGTTNDFYGLAMFQAQSRGSPAPDPPDRVEIEQTAHGSALLSWVPSPVANQYYIFRAERNSIFVRPNANLANYTPAEIADIEGLNFTAGTSIPDVYVGAYTQIPGGVTTDPFFFDTTVQAGHQYMYYVETVKAPVQQSNISDPSNLVAFPLLTPSVTFAQLLRELDVIEQRQRVKNPVEGLSNVRQMILSAQSLAVSCQISAALKKLNSQKAYSEAVDPEATDFEILISKLVRRLQLYSQFPNDVTSNEFCSQP